MKKIAESIIKLRWVIIVITIIITITFGVFIPHLKVNPDVMTYLPDDDEVANLFDAVGNKYGGNQAIALGIEFNDVFTYENLTTIKDITDNLHQIPGIASIISLTNIIDIKEEDSVLVVSPLIDEYDIPEEESELKALKDYTLAKEMYNGFIVSNDASMTMIALKLSQDITVPIDTTKPYSEFIEEMESRYPKPIFELKKHNDSLIIHLEKMTLADVIRNDLQKAYPDVVFYFGGMPFVMMDIGKIIMQDIFFLGPIAVLFILIALFFGFRNWRGLVLPIVTVIIAIIWTLGLMTYLGYEITMISNVTPIILLAVGSAYTIHVINRIINEEKSEIGTHKDKLIKALAYIIIPVFFAAITTMIGFLSFIYGSYLTMIRDFGIFTAIGVIFSLILSLTFAPAIISLFPPAKIKLKPNKSKKYHFITFLLNVFNKVSFTKTYYVIVFWVALIVIMLFGSSLVERKVDLLDYFQEDHESRVSENVLREKFGGTIPLYINIEGNVQSPEVLKAMDEIEEFLSTKETVAHSQSVAGLIKEMNDMMGEGKLIPDEEDKIFNLWFLIDGQEVLDQLVTYDLSSGLIQAILSTSDSKYLSALVDELDEFLKRYDDNEEFKVMQTGFPSIYKRLDESLISSQVQSLLIAIILVFIFVALLLKSPLNGLLATIPITATLAVLFGFLGYANIPLDVATVLVASVSIGIGIDYAIHMITHFNYEMKILSNPEQALINTFKISGKSIVLNVLSVTVGFLVLLFSELVPLQRFGAAVAITMISSGLATLTLLPSTIIIIEKIKHKLKK